MSKAKILRYRAICPRCGTAFDSRGGALIDGRLYCIDCAKASKYATSKLSKVKK